ncbi:MAG: hypothetical protein Q4G16_10955 [Cruoricaptor ignavus]|nr:hypothetical protein [Cruoricaptor ignavus]
MGLETIKRHLGAAIGATMYIGKGLFTNSWSFSGFTKSVLLGAVSGFFTGGLASLFSATSFFATIGVGVLTGGTGGGIDAIINGTDFFNGLLRGAVFGGVVAGISYTVNYLLTNSKASYMEASNENTLEAGNPTPVGKRSYARELYKSQFEQQSGISSNDIYNRANPGGTMGKDGFIHTKIDGEDVTAFGVTKTGKDFITGKIKSKIYLAHNAFSSREQLAYVMQHELNHVRIDWSSFSGAAGTKISFKNDDAGYLYHKNLNNIGHYYIEESGTNFLINNGWNNMIKHIPERVWNHIWYRDLNNGIRKLLEGTYKAIKINF